MRLAERDLVARNDRTLRADVRSLAQHGHLPPDTLDSLPGCNANDDLATSLETLANTLRQHWPELQGKCAIPSSDLADALRLAKALRVGTNKRPLISEEHARALDEQRRAFTLLVRGYDEIRRAVCYLRWHAGDADRKAPSMYGRKKVGRRGREVGGGGA